MDLTVLNNVLHQTEDGCTGRDILTHFSDNLQFCFEFRVIYHTSIYPAATKKYAGIDPALGGLKLPNMGSTIPPMEGPSVHLVADELARFEEQTIRSATGNAKQPLADLEGEEITGVRAVKKRLFLDTPNRHVVVHFLMYGSYRVNADRDLDERLSLECDTDTLNVYSCSVKVLAPDDPELADYDQPDGDVLAPAFDREAAIRSLISRTEPVADILLDQQVFGGVGNIIKNEVLWEVGIHPTMSGSDMAEATATHLTDTAIQWSRDWYRRKKNDKSLDTQIYRADECPECGTAVTREEIGTHDRVTYWCPTCQSP